MKKNEILKISTALIFCVFLLMTVNGFEKYNNIQNPEQAFRKDLQKQEEVIVVGDVVSRNVINVLLLGVDSTETREANEMGYRSDAIMVASMDLDMRKVKMISIPRDTYTDVPGNDKKDKINHAMAFGGGPRRKGNQYAVEAVENLLGIDIHYYATLDLDAVKDVVDMIGGVTVNVERSMGSGARRLEKGEQTLNGEQALIYLSNRNAPMADLARIGQQQNFMMALFQQTKEKGRFSDILPLYLKMQNKIFTDLKIDQIGALVLFLKDLNPEDIEVFTLRGSNMTIDGIFYLDVDTDYIQEIINGITMGKN
ncbi:transcriptional regulator LytR family [Clostridium aceticum]|uniref:Transcriptional regulator LytR family n=1 Tax=Clostridium aceticum TaxID=84022 RepID=A0A0D8I8M6_9CLOT|nr:LCP family protein [Clostridium aceticum]AKL93678.1 transcriptional regulator LytR family [Clostridium aceticum]KJF25591.1 hypothetical protein TZ02_17795 [Clostridium aceticum]